MTWRVGVQGHKNVGELLETPHPRACPSAQPLSSAPPSLTPGQGGQGQGGDSVLPLSPAAPPPLPYRYDVSGPEAHHAHP